MRLEDPRIEELVLAVEEYSNKIALLLSEMAVSNLAVVRSSIRNEVRKTLQELRNVISSWAGSEFVEIVKTLELSILNSNEPEESGSLLPIGLVAQVLNSLLQDLDTAIRSIESTSNQLLRGNLSILGELGLSSRQAILAGASVAVLASLRTRIATALQDSSVRIIGSDGRARRYSLPYYTGLATHTAKGLAQRQLAVSHAQLSGADLVQVSKNRSTIGDYCDLYRGKVFSISGSHPIFPPLSSAPAGGTPFHPWCHHTLSLFDDSKLTNSERNRLAAIPKEFLELGELGSSPSQFQKLWKSRKSEFV